MKTSRCTGHRGKINLGGCFTHWPLETAYLPKERALIPVLAYWNIKSFTVSFIDSVTALFTYLTAICSQGCSHGSCVSPNRCQCSSGWTNSTCGTGTSNWFAMFLVGESLYNGVHSLFQFLYFEFWFVSLLSSFWFVCNTHVKNDTNLKEMVTPKTVCFFQPAIKILYWVESLTVVLASEVDTIPM